jgi:hypothetical protein
MSSISRGDTDHRRRRERACGYFSDLILRNALLRASRRMAEN